MREVHQRLAHRLVQRHHLDVLEVLLDNLAVLVLHHQHLLGLRHPVDQHPPHLGEDRRVGGEARGLGVRRHRGGERRHRPLQLDLLVVEIVREEVPVLRADLEDLVVVHLGDVDEVLETLDQVPHQLLGLEDRQVGLEDGGEEEGEALHELLAGNALVVVLLDRRRLDDVGEVGDEVGVHLLHFRVVLCVHALRVDRRNLGEALQGVAAELRLREELVEKHVDERRLKHIVQRHPEEEAEEALEGGLEGGGVLGVLHHELAQLVDQLELLGEALLEAFDLARRQLLQRELEHLLRQELEDLHVVAAERLVRLARLDNLRDEVLPVVRPLLFQNLDEDEVELAELRLRPHKRLLVTRVPDDDVDDVGLDRLALVYREHLPPVLDAVLQRRQRKELALLALGLLQDAVHARPRLGVLLEGGHEGVDLLSLRLVAASVHGHHHLVEERHIERLVEVKELVEFRRHGGWFSPQSPARLAGKSQTPGEARLKRPDGYQLCEQPNGSAVAERTLQTAVPPG
mmetsp:Transcript_48320/g.114984  ORF Transcript_48320/g.114984 Transcript_48320/m.114984 type:complete len:515 (+) Transcript_48320:2151-3695(+)